MPAALIEIGFLTHAEEAQRLSRRAQRRRLARAIADAVAEFARSVPDSPAEERGE